MFGFSFEKLKETAESVRHQVAQQALKTRDAISDTFQRKQFHSADELDKFLIWQSSQITTSQQLIDVTNQWIAQIRNSKSLPVADIYELTATGDELVKQGGLEPQADSILPTTLTYFQIFLRSRALETLLLTVAHNRELRAGLGSNSGGSMPLATLLNISLMGPELFVDRLLNILSSADVASNGILLNCLCDLVNRLKHTWMEDWLEERQAALLDSRLDSNAAVPKRSGRDTLDDWNFDNRTLSDDARLAKARRELNIQRCRCLSQMSEIKNSRRNDFCGFVSSSVLSLKTLIEHLEDERASAANRVVQHQGQLLRLSDAANSAETVKEKAVSEALEAASVRKSLLLVELDVVQQEINSLTDQKTKIHAEIALVDQRAMNERTKINSMIVKDRMAERLTSQGIDDVQLMRDLLADPFVSEKLVEMLEALEKDAADMEKSLTEQRSVLDGVWAERESAWLVSLCKFIPVLEESMLATRATRMEALAKATNLRGDVDETEKAEMRGVANDMQGKLYRLRRDFAKVSNDLNESWLSLQEVDCSENLEGLKEQVKCAQRIADKALEFSEED